jgi:hypothetical protein
VSRKQLNTELARALRSAASAIEHGRMRSARQKVEKVFDNLAPEPLVIEIGDGILQDVWTLRDGKRVPVTHHASRPRLSRSPRAVTGYGKNCPRARLPEQVCTQYSQCSTRDRRPADETFPCGQL